MLSLERDHTGKELISYDNIELEQLTSTKFLGIIKDTLTWDEHIKLITRKLSKILGSLYKLRRCLPKGLIRSTQYASVNSSYHWYQSMGLSYVTI